MPGRTHLRSRSLTALVALAGGVVALSSASFARAAGAESGHPGAATAPPLEPGPPGASAPLPAGHPNVIDPGIGSQQKPHAPVQLPAGQEPEDEDDDPHGGAGGNGDPHGGVQGSIPGVYKAPEDTETEAPDLPVGTIEAHVLDENNRPIPHASITLGILKNSVAKGESRERVIRDADANGAFVFTGLTVGTGIAYRVSSNKDGGSYAAMPFQLPAAKGMRVILHVFPATSRIEEARVFSQVALAVEVKDDRVQIEEMFSIFNFSPVAWVPNGQDVIALPAEYTAFNAQQEMSDTGADAVPGRGVKLHGTFGPGRHDVSFRWQLPYDQQPELSFAVSLPPHVASARVLAAAAASMKLDVDGFPTPKPQTDDNGTRLLVTERGLQSAKDVPITSLHVALHDLPTAGPAKLVATGIASVGVLAGLAFAVNIGRGDKSPARRKRTKDARKKERAQLLADLEELERAHRDGDVGPKTYERERREIIDGLATLLAEAEEKPAAPAA